VSLLEIGRHNLPRRAVVLDAATLQPHGARTNPRNRAQVVADQEHRSVTLSHLGYLPHALLSERRVSDGQHLVDDDDRRLEMGRHGESQTQLHALRVALYRGVEKALHT